MNLKVAKRVQERLKRMDELDLLLTQGNCGFNCWREQFSSLGEEFTAKVEKLLLQEKQRLKNEIEGI